MDHTEALAKIRDAVNRARDSFNGAVAWEATLINAVHEHNREMEATARRNLSRAELIHNAALADLELVADALEPKPGPTREELIDIALAALLATSAALAGLGITYSILWGMS